MKKFRVIILLVALLAFLNSLALANGLNLNGLGAKAVAMGGAFVGLADDFTAVFWNPAGIAQFDKKYIGFYGSDIIPYMDYSLDVPVPGYGDVNLVDASSMVKHNLVGMAAYYQPISDNLVVGFAAYVPSGLGIEWDGMDLAAISGVSPNPSINWKTKIFVFTFSPVVAYKVNDQLMLGLTLNINYGSFSTSQWSGAAEIPFPPYALDLGQQNLDMKGWGIGATFGILYKPSEMFSIGATFRTPSKINFSGETTVSGIGQLGPLVGGTIETTADVEADVTSPMWLAAGIAFKPTRNITLTADAQYTQWSKIDIINLAFTDPSWVLLMEQTEGNMLKLEWDSRVQIRFGAEYKLTEKLALRGGYYYDPSAAPDMTRNILLPITDFNCFAFGIGYELNGVHIDLGAEYLSGKEKSITYMQTLTDPDYESAMPGVYNLKILALEFCMGYRW
ncbi:MAG: outer membrane protein transport protein [Candidatus Aminicenantes bacterium]|nr:outer membrane protein transport protein [Candidatus Aminicenantes bacterium]